MPAVQVRVEEELAFIDCSSIFKRIVATAASWGEHGGGGDGLGDDSEAGDSGKRGGVGPVALLDAAAALSIWASGRCL
jgi:hypothetical protein